MKTVINNEGKKVSVPTFIYNMLKKAYNEGDWMVLLNPIPATKSHPEVKRDMIDLVSTFN